MGPLQILDEFFAEEPSTTRAALKSAAETMWEAAYPGSTVKAHHSAIKKWMQYTNVTGRTPWIHPTLSVGDPVYGFQVEKIAGFLAFCRSTDCKATTARHYLGPVGAMMEEKFGYNTLNDYWQIKRYLKGYEKLDAKDGKAPDQKEPFTIDMLAAAMHILDMGNANDVAIFAALTLGICFMLRASELVETDSNHYLRNQDATFQYDATGRPCSLTLIVRSSKTNLYPVPRTLAVNGSPTCAVLALWRYLQLSRNSAPLAPLLQLRSGKFSRKYLAARIHTLAKVSNGGKPLNTGSHSLRRGGATALCQQAHIQGYVIQNFGRWGTDTWIQIYQRLTKVSAVILAEALRPTVAIRPAISSNGSS